MVAKTANEPELVGGDFSDVFVVDDSHVVVLIGDVAGKGVRAAGLTETVRSTVRAFATIDPSPAFILGKAQRAAAALRPRRAARDRLSRRARPGDRPAAATPAPATPPPIHLARLPAGPSRSPSARRSAPSSTPYANAHAMLTLDDYLVLYTDGVTEARRGGELFGEAAPGRARRRPARRLRPRGRRGRARRRPRLRRAAARRPAGGRAAAGLRGWGGCDARAASRRQCAPGLADRRQEGLPASCACRSPAGTGRS